MARWGGDGDVPAQGRHASLHRRDEPNPGKWAQETVQRCREFIKPTKRPGKRCHGTRQCTNPMFRLVWRRQREGAVPMFNPEPRLHEEIA